jgi:single-stranded DNA-specific DHH superfamily exonuclease
MLIVAGSILHRTLTHLGHSEDLIRVHHLTKGTNLHTDEQREKMEAYNTDKVVVLDQGSRPGRSIVSEKEEGSKRTLIVDHHMADEVSILYVQPLRLTSSSPKMPKFLRLAIHCP